MAKITTRSYLSQVFLIPYSQLNLLVDMFNYQYHGRKTHWQFSASDQGFVIDAKEDIPRNQEASLLSHIASGRCSCIMGTSRTPASCSFMVL
jgi:hypothetical protein